MQTIYQKMETTELDAAIEALKAEVAEVKAKGLALDMARGKPSPSQVDISRPMLDILNADADLHDGIGYESILLLRLRKVQLQKRATHSGRPWHTIRRYLEGNSGDNPGNHALLHIVSSVPIRQPVYPSRAKR